MDVKTFAARILRKLPNYTDTESEFPEWSRALGANHIIGLYKNYPDRDDDSIVVSPVGVHIRNLDQLVHVPFDEMVKVELPDDKLNADGLWISLRTGNRVFVPVLGKRGQFRDVFEFVRFLDRVLAIRTL